MLFFINILVIIVAIYLVFFFIFFMIFGIVSVDTIIGIAIVFLFYLIYYFLNRQALSFFISKSRIIYIFFLKLHFLYSFLKDLILVLNKNYLSFLNFKFIGLNLSLNSLSFDSIRFNFFYYFNINKVYTMFLLKFLNKEIYGKILKEMENLIYFDNILNNYFYNNYFIFNFFFKLNG